MSHNCIVALTIGGSSTTGAAGVEADLKTFAAFGVHAAVVITAIAPQNTREVLKISYIDGEVVSRQIDSVFSDMDVKSVKIGMLGNGEIVDAVLNGLKKWRARNVVLDPVMTAQSDSSWLINEESIVDMEKLLKFCRIVTPNPFEAERLSGVKIRNLEDAKNAARILRSKGAESVVIKGVRSGERIADVMLCKKVKVFTKKFIRTGTHGGGCCFSSGLAACLARGAGIEESFETVENFIDDAVRNSVKIGEGVEAVNPMFACGSERYEVIQDIEASLEEIENCSEFSSLIPEVGMNIVYALPNARSTEEVAGVVGRVRNAMGKPKSLGEVRFGASSHLARAVLRMMKFDRCKRAAVNIRFSEKNLRGCKRMGLSISYYDRSEEPQSVKRMEGATIQWGIESAVRKAKGIPNVVYHLGEVGKEPSIIIFGNNARDVTRTALTLILPKG